VNTCKTLNTTFLTNQTMLCRDYATDENNNALLGLILLSLL